MNNETKIRIALVEDQLVNRNTFIRKCTAMNSCELVLLATDGHDCLRQLKTIPESLLPQVLFVDLEMPGMNGIETIATAHKLYPFLRFLVLTVFDDDAKIFDAIKIGAEGYLLKHETASVLEDAVHNLLEFGGAPMSPPIARKALQMLHRSGIGAAEDEQHTPPTALSEREVEVLELMVSGLDAKAICIHLDLSVHTVRKHIANIYNKLHVRSKAQIISLAHLQGWFKRTK
ncbi:MAG: response regulator transcription factor [Bacteroidetes bacterium]|nr:response regulator transcription factor [Bacteroidota bacterium]MBS1741125.1 response regulator transcription factor [Bacteroidota bacterium]